MSYLHVYFTTLFMLASKFQMKESVNKVVTSSMLKHYTLNTAEGSVSMMPITLVAKQPKRKRNERNYLIV